MPHPLSAASTLNELIDVVVIRAKIMGSEEDHGTVTSHLDAQDAYLAARARLDQALKPILERA